jgi:hypothetical protein
MSLKIISKLIKFIQVTLNIREEEVIVKSIKFELEDNTYIIELKVGNEIYSIMHFEPLKMLPDVNYGMGPYYDCYLFDKEKGFYKQIKLN